METHDDASNSPLSALEDKLATLDSERAKLILEINNLRNDSKDTSTRALPSLLGSPVLQRPVATPAEKIQLFLALFRCREDVFPRRWENLKTGKQGYSLACENEWVKPICQKPKIRCSECTHQKFPPLNEDAAGSHLKGLATIGTYAIREDDSCVFLACDADLAIGAVNDKSFPLLISDRKDHLDLLQALIKEGHTEQNPIEIVRLDGDLSGKERRHAIEQIAILRAAAKPMLLMSTASLIG